VRLLVDNQLPVALAQWLVAHGADAVHVPNLGPAPVPETGIWARAAAEDRIVVSKD
jgi:predicted nuclease of predicted toxin-antitoxin system